MGSMSRKKHITKTDGKKELDRKRSLWRKQHRTLNGRIILYPDNPPEHVNARGNKLYNWFWKKILLEIQPQEIPAVISNLQDQISGVSDGKKIQMFRTMIGMAEDAYKLKKLDDILDYDPEIMMEKKPVYNAEDGVIYKGGKLYTTDYNEDESGILVRDIEGMLLDILSSESIEKSSHKDERIEMYKHWDYMEKK